MGSTFLNLPEGQSFCSASLVEGEIFGSSDVLPDDIVLSLGTKKKERSVVRKAIVHRRAKMKDQKTTCRTLTSSSSSIETNCSWNNQMLFWTQRGALYNNICPVLCKSYVLFSMLSGIVRKQVYAKKWISLERPPLEQTFWDRLKSPYPATFRLNILYMAVARDCLFTL